MASAVDICNLALAHLSDSATVSSIDPPEGSVQAEHCARFYPIARDALLEMHQWSFAMRRTELALSGDAPSTWAYSYSVPASCVRVTAVLPQGAERDEQGVDFVQENGYVYTNEANASARYITRVTDTTRFTPLFVTTLSWLLANFLVGPVRDGDARHKAATRESFSTWLNSAVLLDAQTHKQAPQHSVSWMNRP